MPILELGGVNDLGCFKGLVQGQTYRKPWCLPGIIAVPPPKKVNQSWELCVPFIHVEYFHV